MSPETFRTIKTPAARATDPESSHLAAEEITESGVRQQQIGQAITAVRDHPGSTSRELAELTGLDRYMLGRRLSDAAATGAIRKGGKDEMRVCQVSNRLALTWHPAAVSVKVV